jgi:hypothetical protein
LYRNNNIEFPSGQRTKSNHTYEIHYNFQNPKYEPNINYSLFFYALHFPFGKQLPQTHKPPHPQHLENQYIVINSSTPAMDLIELKINNKHRLLTLDIKDLYVNISIKEVINITKTQLLIHNDKHTSNQLTMLLETILGQNYFTFHIPT